MLHMKTYKYTQTYWVWKSEKLDIYLSAIMNVHIQLEIRLRDLLPTGLLSFNWLYPLLGGEVKRQLELISYFCTCFLFGNQWVDLRQTQQFIAKENRWPTGTCQLYMNSGGTLWLLGEGYTNWKPICRSDCNNIPSWPSFFAASFLRVDREKINIIQVEMLHHVLTTSANNFYVSSPIDSETQNFFCLDDVHSSLM